MGKRNQMLELGGLGVVGKAALGAVAKMKWDAQKAEQTRPLVITGPSGAGKGTLIEMLKTDFPQRVGFVVSHTTRQPRSKGGQSTGGGAEVNGIIITSSRKRSSWHCAPTTASWRVPRSMG